MGASIVPEDLDGSTEANEITEQVLVAGIIAIFVATFLRFVETQVFPIVRQRCIGLDAPPYTLSVFCAGFLVSAGVDLSLTRAGHSTSVPLELIQTAVAALEHTSPVLIIQVLLPPLIYNSAASMNYHIWTRIRSQSILLAFPGVLLQIAVVGPILRFLVAYLDNREPWSWDLSFMLASILTATDPVAVVATLHQLGAPEMLSDVIDGESLLNDGSAYVMFLAFKFNVDQLAQGLAPHTPWTGLLFFLRLSLGGVLLGWVIFRACIAWLTFIERDWRAETGVLVIAVYACFTIAELVAGVSGVLATVTFGLLMAKRGNYTFSPAAAAVVEPFMQVLAHFSESLLFFIAGAVVWSSLYTEREPSSWALAPVLYVILYVVRGVVVFCLYPILMRTGYRPSPREGIAMVHAGLRGAVGLALSLLVAQDESVAGRDRQVVTYAVAGVTSLTLLINASTMQLVYDALKLYPANKHRQVVVAQAIDELEGAAMEDIKRTLLQATAQGHGLSFDASEPAGTASAVERRGDVVYSLANWDAVLCMIPEFRGTGLLENDRLRIPAGARSFVFADTVMRVAAGAPYSLRAAKAAKAEAKAKERETRAPVPPIQRQASRNLESYSMAERREIVRELFAILRAIYEEQHSAKQLDGAALAVCMEALGAGADAAATAQEHPVTTAFADEFKALQRQLAPVRPRWRHLARRVPVIGPELVAVIKFQRSFQQTEVLSAFIRAHEALADIATRVTRRQLLAGNAIRSVIADAEKALHNHRVQFSALTSLQINVLTARAAVEMKRKRCLDLVHLGQLTTGDFSQLEEAFSRALFDLDAVRYSITASVRLRRRLRRAIGESVVGVA